MPPKKARLTASEVREVLARGKSIRVGVFSGKWIDGGPRKVAVVVAKKQAKTAVARNRLRRAAYRELPALDVPASGRTVLFVRRT